MKKPGKVEQLMSQVVNDLNDDELTLFSDKLNAAKENRMRTIGLEEITPEQMRDPEFKAAVVSAIQRAAKELGRSD